VLAAIARKDYEDQRKRAAQGTDKAKAEGKYRGLRAAANRIAAILDILKRGTPWSQVCQATRASRSTFSRIVKQTKEAGELVADSGSPPIRV